jgi:hypothetical protein
MNMDKEHEYTAVDLDEDGLKPALRPRRKISTLRLVLYIELAHILLIALLSTVWHLVHRDPYHSMQLWWFSKAD